LQPADWEIYEEVVAKDSTGKDSTAWVLAAQCIGKTCDAEHVRICTSRVAVSSGNALSTNANKSRCIGPPLRVQTKIHENGC
jgi:hypothetical protein